MTDPYKILGVSPSDSDEKIKSAYKELVKKYHPDNYSSSPIGDLANEKTAEINSAFDEIMNMRRGGGYASEASYSNGYSYSSSNYDEIRRAIQNGETTKAEGMLDAVDNSNRSAEWYFLKGSVCYARGWLNDAYDYVTTAAKMEPSNREYQAAQSRMNSAKNGQMNGDPNQTYRTNQNVNSCNGCDCCANLICADCCCECMGGDLISCC